MERVQLRREEVPPTVATAPCLQSVTVCCSYSLGLATFRTHIWSAGQCWLRPSISSCFFNSPPKEELKGERRRDGVDWQSESRSRPWNEQIMASDQLQSGMIHPLTFQQRLGQSSRLTLSQLLIPQLLLNHFQSQRGSASYHKRV